MIAGNHDFEIYQGDLWERTVWWYLNSALVDLTGYTARMHVRTRIAASSTVLELLSHDSGGALIESGTRIILTSPGKIGLRAEPEDTALLTFSGAYYDLELTKDDEPTTILYGQVTLRRGVTRDA